MLPELSPAVKAKKMASATYAAHQVAKPKANMPNPSARRRTSAAPTKPKPIATARGGTKTVRTNAQAAPTRSHGSPERNPSAIIRLKGGLADVALDTRSEYPPPDRNSAGLPALPRTDAGESDGVDGRAEQRVLATRAFA